MSSSDARQPDFGDQAVEILRAMSPEEFRRKLAERCPELLSDPGPPPADAMLPGSRAEGALDAFTAAVARATRLVQGFARVLEAQTTKVRTSTVPGEPRQKTNEVPRPSKSGKKTKQRPGATRSR